MSSAAFVATPSKSTRALPCEGPEAYALDPLNDKNSVKRARHVLARPTAAARNECFTQPVARQLLRAQVVVAHTDFFVDRLEK